MQKGRKITIGIILIVCSFALCSSARCNGKPRMLNRGTQTPGPPLWRWAERHPHRWWHDFVSPMALWFRPEFWDKALDHIDVRGLPIPMTTHPAFPDQWDQLFDTFMEDPWNLIDLNDAHSQEEPNDPDMAMDESNEHTGGDQYLYNPNDITEDAYRQLPDPMFEDERMPTPQNHRSTQYRNSQEANNDIKKLRNHQHQLRRQKHREGSDDYGNNMGTYPSNQPPVQNTNHRNTHRQEDVNQNNGVQNSNQYNQDNHQNRILEQHNNIRNGRNPNVQKNRNSHSQSRQFNDRVSNRPAAIYSLQVPGYRPAELQVRTEGRKVRIVGSQQCGCQDPCTIREFERVTTLPEGIDTRDLQAVINKEGTLSIQAKHTHKRSPGHYQDRDILVEGLDLPPIEDSSKNAENCIKKATIQLAKIDGRTGRRVPITRQHDPLPQRTFENEYEEDGVTIEVVDE